MSVIEERMLQLLDEICLDSLEGLASEQEPKRGHVSSLFHELRGLVLAQGEALRIIGDNAESWHGDDAAKGRALAVIAGWARDPSTIPAILLRESS